MTWLGTTALARDGGGFEPRMTRIYTDGEGAGRHLGKPSRAAFLNLFTSELSVVEKCFIPNCEKIIGAAMRGKCA